MNLPSKKIGQQTVRFTHPPVIAAAAAVVGPMEGEGPLGEFFDRVWQDDMNGAKSWEKAEQQMLQEAVELTLKKQNLTPQGIDFLLAGDLLNQIISANFTARQLGIPFLGLYGACSTMSEGLALGSIILDGGFANTVIAAASSHHNTAERQYRFPTELGSQRPMSSQWTVTGAGAALLAKQGNGPCITYATIGKVVDLGIKDANDMGSAMAPAAADTIVRHLQDTGRTPEYYDLIITGDLGTVGKTLTAELVKKQGYDLGTRFTDCGILIYDPSQDVHAGGSGCGCSAAVFCGSLFKDFFAGKYQKILLVGTGALLSPCSAQQGDSIPGIGHGVAIESSVLLVKEG